MSAEQPEPKSPKGEPPYDCLRDSLGEAFVIFRATVAICSIFIGFVFAALLLVLTSPMDLTGPTELAVWCLTLAMVFLLIAVLGYHRVANQVVQFWRIFFPESQTRIWATFAFVLGVLGMLAAVSLLLWASGFAELAIVVILTALGLFVWMWSLGMIHRENTGVSGGPKARLDGFSRAFGDW